MSNATITKPSPNVQRDRNSCSRDGIGLSILSFQKSRDPGDDSVLLGEKSVGFDEKTKGYMGSNPEFLPSYIPPVEVLKDRTARVQYLKFMPQMQLVGKKTLDTFNIIGNEIMKSDLAYYNATGDAEKRGIPSAGDIHADLATRYPGRPSKGPIQPPPQTPP